MELIRHPTPWYVLVRTRAAIRVPGIDPWTSFPPHSRITVPAA
jgi:hypothetical protein